MLRNLNSLIGHSIHATDGDLGKVKEFFFDDLTWRIRYVVVETGDWLSSRKVLISPIALKKPDWDARILPVALTREQVSKSPDIDTEETVSRQHETDLAGHYDWPLYWGAFTPGGMSGGFPYLPEADAKGAAAVGAFPEKAAGDPHLRSTRKVAGYRLHATDGQLGEVEDYIVDDENWVIRYLVTDTGLWLAGRKVLVSPHWVKNVNWERSEVFVDMNMEAVRKSPEFDPSRPVSRDYESVLYDHYGRPKEETALKK